MTFEYNDLSIVVHLPLFSWFYIFTNLRAHFDLIWLKSHLLIIYTEG